MLFCTALSACGGTPELTPDVSMSCTSYCGLAQLRCHNAQLLFSNADTCQKVCAAFDASGTPGATAGDSLQCRLSYLVATNRSNALAFCRNASPAGGSACVGAP